MEETQSDNARAMYYKIEKEYVRNLTDLVVKTHFFNCILINNKLTSEPKDSLNDVFNDINGKRSKPRYTKFLNTKRNKEIKNIEKKGGK